MVAGLFANLTHEAAARFAFLLATPVIFGAGALKIPDLFTPVALPHLPVYLLGGAVAGGAAFLSVAYLMRYFRVGRLDPFAYYCVAFGILSLILLIRSLDQGGLMQDNPLEYTPTAFVVFIVLA